MNDDLLTRVSAKVRAWGRKVMRTENEDYPKRGFRILPSWGVESTSCFDEVGVAGSVLVDSPATCNGALLAILREVADPNAYVRRDNRDRLGDDWVVRLDRGPTWLGTVLIYGATEFEALLNALDEVLP